MMVLDLTCLALSAALSAAPPSTVQMPVTAVTTDSAPALLTVDALTRMTTFWQTFMKEDPTIRDQGRKENQEKVTIPVAPVSGVQMPGTIQTQVVNMVAMASKYPSVVTDFKTAGLTPQQWEQDRVALFGAALVNQADQSGKQTGDGSVVWKNVAFLRQHQTEFQALQATGMFIPKPQMQGGGGGNSGDDLSP
jgi:hypothetical protein